METFFALILVTMNKKVPFCDPKLRTMLHERKKKYIKAFLQKKNFSRLATDHCDLRVILLPPALLSALFNYSLFALARVFVA
jgi:hypothetical protein